MFCAIKHYSHSHRSRKNAEDTSPHRQRGEGPRCTRRSLSGRRPRSLPSHRKANRKHSSGTQVLPGSGLSSPSAGLKERASHGLDPKPSASPNWSRRALTPQTSVASSAPPAARRQQRSLIPSPRQKSLLSGRRSLARLSSQKRILRKERQRRLRRPVLP